MHVFRIAKLDTMTVVGCVMKSRQTMNMQKRVHLKTVGKWSPLFLIYYTIYYIDDCMVCGIIVGIRSRNFDSSSYILTSSSGY